MESKEFDNGLTIVFWNKGSKELGIAQASLNNPNRFLVGITTRQFDYECGWRPNKEWKSTIKGFFPKEEAIQMAKEKVRKGIKEDKMRKNLRERVLDFDAYDEFYKKGCEAYFEGKSLDEVPVTGNAWFREAWQEGWKDSKAADDEDARRTEAEYEEELEWEEAYREGLIESELCPRDAFNRRQRSIDRENKATLAYAKIDDEMSKEFVKDQFFKKVPSSHHWSETIGKLTYVCTISEDNCIQARFSTYKNGEEIDSRYVYLNGDCVEKFYDYINGTLDESKNIKSKKSFNEVMVKSPNEKGQWHAVDFASLVFDVVKKEYDKKGKVYDCNQFAAEDQGWKRIGPWGWVALMSLTGRKYDVEIECANDENYCMKLYVKEEDVYVTQPLIEWTGKGLEEFMVDFEDAISMNWEK